MEEFDKEYNLHRDYPEPIYKKEYPNKDIDIDEYYIDQTMVNIYYADRHFFGAYTPWGIKGIESWFTKQILSGKNKKKLSYMIRRNPHLHNVIKTNLLENLKNCRK